MLSRPRPLHSSIRIYSVAPSIWPLPALPLKLKRLSEKWSIFYFLWQLRAQGQRFIRYSIKIFTNRCGSAIRAFVKTVHSVPHFKFRNYCALENMILLFMVLYPYSSRSESWALASNPTPAFMNDVDLAPPQITPGPEIGSKGIFARANIATCGYISGNAGEESKNPPFLLLGPVSLTAQRLL